MLFQPQRHKATKIFYMGLIKVSHPRIPLAEICYRRGSLSPTSSVSPCFGLQRKNGLSHHLVFMRCRALVGSLPLSFGPQSLNLPGPLESRITNHEMFPCFRVFLRSGLGCRLSVPGLPGNSPDFHPALTRRRAFSSRTPDASTFDKFPVYSIRIKIPPVLIIIK